MIDVKQQINELAYNSWDRYSNENITTVFKDWSLSTYVKSVIGKASITATKNGLKIPDGRISTASAHTVTVGFLMFQDEKYYIAGASIEPYTASDYEQENKMVDPAVVNINGKRIIRRVRAVLDPSGSWTLVTSNIIQEAQERYSKSEKIRLNTDVVALYTWVHEGRTYGRILKTKDILGWYYNEQKWFALSYENSAKITSKTGGDQAIIRKFVEKEEYRWHDWAAAAIEQDTSMEKIFSLIKSTWNTGSSTIPVQQKLNKEAKEGFRSTATGELNKETGEGDEYFSIIRQPLEYIDNYPTEDIMEDRPGTSDIFLYRTGDGNVRAHIPAVLPEKPFVAPYSLASDMGAVVLEEGLLFRVGDVRLPLTVESISVQEQQPIDTQPLLRNRGTVKRSTGHAVTRISINVLYNTLDDINGWTLDHHGEIISDPLTTERPILSGLLFEHGGLRPLIATFRRAPFIPIINSTLNNMHNIDAVAFESVQIETVPEAPTCLRATLTFLKFDYSIYIPDATNFASLFNWPLYQKYIYNGLCIPEEIGKMKAPVLSGKEDIAKKNVQNTVPSYYELRFNKEASPPKLRPLPVLQKNSDSTIERVYELQGGVTFYVAREDELKTIRDANYERGVEVSKLMKQFGEAQEDVQTIPKKIEELNNRLNRAKKQAKTLAITGKAVRIPQDDKTKDFLDNLQKKQAPGKTQEEINKIRNTITNSGEYTQKEFIDNVDELTAQIEALESKLKASTEKYQNVVQSGDILAELGAKNFDESILHFDQVTLPNDTILIGVGVTMRNTFAMNQLESREQPAIQYLGAQDNEVSLVFECQEPTVKALHELREHIQFISREYRFIRAKLADLDVQFKASHIKDWWTSFTGQQLETGFVKLDQEIANLCGIESVLITDIDYDVIPETPGWYRVVVKCVDFDRTQKKHERLNRTIGNGFDGSLGSFNTMVNDDDSFKLSRKRIVSTNEGTTSAAKNMMRDDKNARQSFLGIDLYPDLELPTYSTVNAWIQELVVAHVPSNKIKHGDLDGVYILDPITNEPRCVPFFAAENYDSPDGKAELMDVVHVDPDFYIATTSLSRQLMVEQIMQTNLTDKGETGSSTCGKIVLSDEHDSGLMAYSVAPQSSADAKKGAELEDAVLEVTTQLGENLTNTTVNTASQTSLDPTLLGRQNNTITVPQNALPFVYTDAPAEDYNEHKKKPDSTMGGVGFIESSFFSHFVDWYQYGGHGRLLKAFPTYWIQLIDGGKLAANLLFGDSFYGMNGVVSVKVAKHREHAPNVCLLEVSNVYGNLTNQSAQRALDEGIRREGWWRQAAYFFMSIGGKRYEDIDIIKRFQTVSGLMLQTGARLHVRMGYGNCPYALPVVFNGTITEVPGGTGVVTIVAIGDGAELLADLQATPNQKLGYLIHGAEPQHILANILGARGGLPQEIAGSPWQRFGEWFKNLTYHMVPTFRPENPLGVTHFGNPFYRVGGEKMGECMQNIYRSNDRGARPGHTYKYRLKDNEALDNAGRPWEAGANFSEWLAYTETMSSGQKEFSTDLFGKTIWDLCTLSHQVAPDYICQTVPFGFRSTLFYGKPYYNYCYEYDYNKLSVPFFEDNKAVKDLYGNQVYVPFGILPEHWKDQEEYDSIMERVKGSAKHMWPALAVIAPWVLLNPSLILTTAAFIIGSGVVAGNLLSDNVLYCDPKFVAKDLQSDFKDATGEVRSSTEIVQQLAESQIRKPFQQVYGLTSLDDIIANNITASSEDIYTVVRGSFKAAHWSILGIKSPWAGEDSGEKGVTIDMTLNIYADVSIFPEYKRTATVETEIFVSKYDQLLSPITNRDPHGNMPNNVATSILKNFMNYMYKGKVSILGIPSIKPCDLLVIDDTYNELHGPVGVREVVHSLDADTGLTTVIEPDALVSIADHRLLRNWTLFRCICGDLALTRMAAHDNLHNERRNSNENFAEQIRFYEELVKFAEESGWNATTEEGKKLKTELEKLSWQYHAILDNMNSVVSQDKATYLDTALNKKKVPFSRNMARKLGLKLLSGKSDPEIAYSAAWERNTDLKDTYTPFDCIYTSKLERERIYTEILNYEPKRAGRTTRRIGTIEQEEQRALLKKTAQLEAPYYRPMHGTFGPSGLVIARLGALIAGNAGVENGYLYKLATYLGEIDVESMILFNAAASIAEKDQELYAHIVSKINTSLQDAVDNMHDTLVETSSWFSSTDKENARAKLIADTKNNVQTAEYKKEILRLLKPVSIKNGETVESPLVIGQLLMQCETGVQAKPERVGTQQWIDAFGKIDNAYQTQLILGDTLRSTSGWYTLRAPYKTHYFAQELLTNYSSYLHPLGSRLLSEYVNDNAGITGSRFGVFSIIAPVLLNHFIFWRILKSRMMQKLLMLHVNVYQELYGIGTKLWNKVANAGVTGNLIDKVKDALKTAYAAGKAESVAQGSAKTIAWLEEFKQGNFADGFKGMKKAISDGWIGKSLRWLVSKQPEGYTAGAMEVGETLTKSREAIANAAEAAADAAEAVRAQKTLDLGKELLALRRALKAAEAAGDAAEVAKITAKIGDVTKTATQIAKAASKAARIAKQSKAGVSAVKCIFEASNPIGWAVLALEVALDICVGNLVNFTNRATRNLHAVQMILLRKHGSEFSAGINGHEGLIYGERPHKIQQLFNEWSAEGPHGGLSPISIAGSILGIRFPYLYEKGNDESTWSDRVDDQFNSRSFGESMNSDIMASTRLGDVGVLLSEIKRTSSTVPVNDTPATQTTSSSVQVLKSNTSVKVLQVIDHRTLLISGNKRVRLAGIYGPSLQSEIQAEKKAAISAMNIMRTLFHRYNNTITIEYDKGSTDSVWVSLGANSLNVLLVEQGYVSTTRALNKEMSTILADKKTAAIAKKIGIWSLSAGARNGWTL